MKSSFHICIVCCAVLFSAISTTQSASADLLLDLRAISVSGTDVSLVNSKSVNVTNSSGGGMIDFELYAVVNGTDGSALNEGFQTYTARLVSRNTTGGAVLGDLLNSDSTGGALPRGLLSPFNSAGSAAGALQDLDADTDLDLGSLNDGSFSSWIGGRAASMQPYSGGGSSAEFLLYRFSMNLADIQAPAIGATTDVVVEGRDIATAFLWQEDGGASIQAGASDSRVSFSPAVVITNVSPIPEPSSVALALVGSAMLGIAIRRRNRLAQG
ncbi:MAG: PEP-CTERM sorting domain-containing protein [Planctomycetota bacterium]|nr:PEP-CTERM sorting domain-containing protein [Planctomycetota bacterium]